MDFGNATVFAVLDVPQPPPVDTGFISGKSGNFVGPCGEAKEQAPCLDLPRHAAVDDKKEVADPEIELDESDPAFALFIDSPVAIPPGESLRETCSVEKPSSFELQVEGEDVDGVMVDFERFCRSMEASFQRVSRLTRHLM